MKIFIICILLFLSVFSFSVCASGSDFESGFRMPPARFGSAPFWSWNEKLEPDELVWQIDEFAEKGMGGVFMHAREGLITGYMSDEWLEAVRVSVARAKEKGLKAYMYDEDRWPSGYASGMVTRTNPDFRQKALVRLERDEPMTAEEIAEVGELAGVFDARLDGTRMESFRIVDHETAKNGPRAGSVRLYFVMAAAGGREWFNGEAYIDTMNPAAVDTFIRVTHEEYKKVIGGEFGKTVPAIFTDEPEYISGREFPGLAVPWTPALPKVFEEKYGYSLLEKLPLLFYEGEGAAGVRVDFRTTATEMFRDAFAKRIFDWCEENGIALTGHYMLEDTLESQIRRIGAAMPHYEYMQMPGMDHLGRNINDLLTAKQVSSVAHQFSRPLILTETYGCSGWNLSFENMKWMSDWHYALGVNFMNQHLSWYTMRGCRKRDYPASIQYQSPWWKYHKIIADYLRRATYVTASGDFVADALVLHPITAAWASYSPLDGSGTRELHDSFNNLLYALTGNRVDYDLGDEIIIARHGAVRGGRFVVKDMEYSSVVIPPGGVLRAGTVKLLKKFISEGGTVVSMGPETILVDAEKPLVIEGIIPAADAAEAVSKLLPHLRHHVSLMPEEGRAADKIYLHQRNIEGAHFMFFANTDAVKPIDVTAAAPYRGRVRMWNLFDGTWSDYPCEAGENGTEVKLHFEPAGSALLSVSPDEPAGCPEPKEPRRVREETIPDDWRVVKRDMNAVTIDMLRYQREGDRALTPFMPHYAAQDSMRSKGTDFKFKLLYKFAVGMEPAGAEELFLVMEQPEGKDISLNGESVEWADAGWWKDKSFKMIDIKGAAKKGKNELKVGGVFKTPKIPGTRIYVEGGTEVESVYVVGDFLVRQGKGGKFRIVAPDDSFRYGDLAEQGYPFFSGSTTIAKDVEISAGPGEKVFLEFDGLEAITTRVWVNGADAGVIAFHPHEIEITPFIKGGGNRIEIELTNSNRNLLGPHHADVREPLSVGPGTFTGQVYNNVYNFIPFGVTGGVRIGYYK